MAGKNEKAAVDPVQKKSEPDAREAASGDEFSKQYLVRLDDTNKIPAELEEQQYIDVRATAIQRGLRPTGDPVLASSEVQDAHNVLLTYTVPVVLATPDAPLSYAAPEQHGGAIAADNKE